eukprot:TRINITY_DN13319_c0_g1_i1.p1 TRINITY_DN13319_c0_g1~~TRINITY_DN13319_c0_g1_i1.p1  ORF type:complete len:638 (-),score=135.35 TRINITY_DN13319_c0_g1_i1:46-1836(-)
MDDLIRSRSSIRCWEHRWAQILLTVVLMAGCCAIVLGAVIGVVAYIPRDAPDPNLSLKVMRDHYAFVNISASRANLSPNDVLALKSIAKAVGIMDDIFVRQVWSGNVALFQQLQHTLATVRAKEQPDEEEVERLQLETELFKINFGPWDRLSDGERFISAAPISQPPYANFYPNITVERFNSWLKQLAPARREDAVSPFYVIRELPDDHILVGVAYNIAYYTHLVEAARQMQLAATLTSFPTLAAYLSSRAEGLLTNVYNVSDLAWLQLDSPIDVTIGPYETYEDALFGYKASYEGIVGIRDDVATSQLQVFKSVLQLLEDNLPENPLWRNPHLGASAAIVVINEVFAGGSLIAGVQTAAFNLPNDASFTTQYGTRRVMLRNIQQAKFQHVLIPIAQSVLFADQLGLVQFDAFFKHILCHELMHGLGPHQIIVNNASTTVHASLKERYSAIEEAKADITALWALNFLATHDHTAIVAPAEMSSMYVTFVASSFRSVRFGVREAHGKGQVLQFNYLVDQGAVVYDTVAKKFRVEIDRMPQAVENLSRLLLTIEGSGSYQQAGDVLAAAVIRGPMQLALTDLEDVPIDIRPQFDEALY